MQNLLKETKAVLKKHGKSFDDVVWIGCEEYQIPVASFMSLADQENGEMDARQIQTVIALWG